MLCLLQVSKHDSDEFLSYQTITHLSYHFLLLPIQFSPVNFDDEDFIAEDMDTDPAKYKTPSSRTPMNRLRPAGPLSASGTSETEHISPALLKTFNRLVYF